MNFAIFTPALATSAIGRATRLVVNALVRQGHQVVIVRSEDVALLERPTHDFGANLIAWNDAANVEIAVQEADMLVYQIGNNYQYHRGCMEWMPVYPGVICLHDFFLGHLFHEWAQYRRPLAKAVLREWYGAEIAERYFTIEENFIENTQDIAPMTEWISSMALAVITHSSWAIQRVVNACAGPVHVIALAYDMPAQSREKVTSSLSSKNLSVLTIGHINPNKRAESVIKAIGRSPQLRDNVTYRLVGQVEQVTKQVLLQLADDLAVKLVISGEVDEIHLQEAIKEADIMCCLRLPALEAASASAIESMLYGKATVVMDTGFYSEIPDRYVKKISPDSELADLQRELESLCNDTQSRIKLGRDAAEWASAHFSGEKYAIGLIDICQSTAKAAPVLEMSRFYSDVLGRWGGHLGETQCDVITRCLMLQ